MTRRTPTRRLLRDLACRPVRPRRSVASCTCPADRAPARDPALRLRWPALALLAGLSACLPAVAAAAGGACSARSGVARVPLVELYTSEGCSSCPPADRWLTREVEAGGQDAHWLAFHVDYWDDLGWPDRFGATAHSERQRQRVAAAGRRTVYTPQVMVGREISAMWRTDRPFRRQLDAERGQARAGLAMRLQPGGADGARLHVGAALTPAGAAAASPGLWVAATRDARFTDVPAGENAGSRLRHDRVVVALWGPWPLGRQADAQSIALPAGDGAGTAWTAFVQAADGEILQSLRLDARGCR